MVESLRYRPVRARHTAHFSFQCSFWPMSLFGSRENDPLLQDDPFAPSGDESSSGSPRSEEAPGEGDPPDSPSDGDTSPSRAQGHEASSDAGDRASPREGETRTLVRSVDEADAGPLPALNTAFDQGWRLETIVHRDETADLRFVLRQKRDGAGRAGEIV